MNEKETEKLDENVSGNGKGFDILFDFIPTISGYQITIVFFGLWLTISAGAIQLAAIILQADPDSFECTEDSNLTYGVNNCQSEGNRCSSFNYSSKYFEETIVTEFDLVCDRSQINSNVKSFGLMGLVFGALIFGFLCDKIGRKNSLLLSSVGCTVFSLGVTFLSPNIIMFSLFRFLSGGFIHGCVPIALIYALEFVGPEYRSMAGATAKILFDFGIGFLSPIAYLCNTWRMMSLALALLPMPFVLMYFFIPESIQYLYSRGKTAAGKKTLLKLMKRTGSDTSKLDSLSDDLYEICRKTSSKANMPKKNSFVEILSSTFRLVTLQCCCIFFCGGFGNYGFLLNPASLSGNLLVNNISMALFDAIGYLSTGLLLNKFGRVRLLKYTFFLTGVFIISSAGIFLLESETNHRFSLIAKTFVFLGKICNSMSFGAIFNFVAELYPTHLRGTAIGIGSAVARIGGFIAPQVLQLKYVHPLFPPVIIGILSFIGAFVSHFMPETNENPLMQSTEEAKKFYEMSRLETRRLL